MTGKSILDVQGPWGGLSFIGMVYRGFCAIFGLPVLPFARNHTGGRRTTNWNQ